MDKDWNVKPAIPASQPIEVEKKRADSDATCHLHLPKQDVPEPVTTASLIDLPNENIPSAPAAVTVPIKMDSPVAARKRAKREEKANRTRKIKVMQVEVRAETQTGMYTDKHLHAKGLG